MYKNSLLQTLNIRYPLVMAPMFLVSNTKMIKAAIEEGIMGCFPSLNFREEDKLDSVLKDLNEFLQSRKIPPRIFPE